jgi:adenine phosphoribosyltransferase
MLKRLREKANSLPSVPGVYIMKNSDGEVIYVGKSKKLKNRVTTYFTGSGHTPKTARMVSLVADFDYIVCPEAKTLPLAQSLCTYLGEKEFVVFRKGAKAYMVDPIVREVKSITTAASQLMVVDGVDVAKIKGKKVLIHDDVVSTGGTFKAMETLLDQIGCDVVGYATVLKEGTDFNKDNLYYIQDLPLWIGAI